jgi:hypothetical protein
MVGDTNIQRDKNAVVASSTLLEDHVKEVPGHTRKIPLLAIMKRAVGDALRIGVARIISMPRLLSVST